MLLLEKGRAMAEKYYYNKIPKNYYLGEGRGKKRQKTREEKEWSSKFKLFPSKLPFLDIYQT